MFFPARMRKLKVITLDEYVDSTVQSLHDAGLVQIQDISEKIQQDPECALIEQSKVKPVTGKVSSLLMKTTSIIDFLDNNVVDDGSILNKIKGFISPPEPDIMDIDIKVTEDLIKDAESLLKEVEFQTKSSELKLSQLETKKSNLEYRIKMAEDISDLDLDLSLLQDTKYSSFFLGSLNVESYERLIKESSDITDELTIEKIKSDDEKVIVAIATLKEHSDDVSTFLRKLEFDRFDLEGLSGKPKDIIVSSNNELSEIAEEKEIVLKELKEIKNKYEQDLLSLKEELENEKEKNEIYDSFGETKRTKILEAWVPLKKLDKALDVIKTSTDDHSVVEVEEPTGDCDDVPTLHDNPRFAKPYEFLVDMYAPLRYKEIDPTIFFSIVFPFFFGFCLTDAFYGILIMILAIVLWNGLGKYSKFMKDFGIVLFGCGFWAFSLGMVTNGFIGDLLPKYLNINIPTVIASFDAFGFPQHILIMALLTGFIYLNLGFLLGAYNNFVYGNKKEALTTQIIWFVFELGIFALILGSLINNMNLGMMIAVPILLISFGLLFYGGGVMGIMDVFSYMGNLLSFARLLALCLATGGFAMTVNILSNLCYTMVPFIGALACVIVFLGGHTFNIAFQSLGAFVNSLRLHYVEMFSLFYMGGKNKFEAFNAKRNFTRVRR